VESADSPEEMVRRDRNPRPVGSPAWFHKAVEWRAGSIADPVERLRFLRRTMGDRNPVERMRGVAGGRRLAAVAAACAALVLAPLGPVAWESRVMREMRPSVARAEAADAAAQTVWLVERGQKQEVWSNGLRVELEHETGNEPRRYQAWKMEGGTATPHDRQDPAGIVFHTTESLQHDFEEGKREKLKRAGAGLLHYVKENRSYHYVIDRFGRVWRVVREGDSANHAGYSVWADAEWAYVNLNRSFLGVSVETQTAPGAAKAPITPAQTDALRVLTEMLRSRHRIAAGNCVTHAQVSVNPRNMLAGYHVDWAANFPYAAAGLPDNYGLPAVSLWLFGFQYDPSLVNVTGQQFWRGLTLGEEMLRQHATANGQTVAVYRSALARRYKQILERMNLQPEQQREPVDHKEKAE